MADVPMPEGFTEEPPMPEGFTEKPVEQPQPVDPSLPPSGSPSPAMSTEVTGFTADDISSEVAKSTADDRAAEKAAQWNRLNAAFASPLFTSENDAAATISISKRLGLSPELVRANLPELRRTADAAEYNPDLWVERNPRLAKLLNRHHELAPAVVRSKTLGDAVNAYEKAVSWLSEKLDVMSPADIAAENEQAKVAGENPDAAKTPDQLRQDTRVRRELDLAGATAPKNAIETDDALAKIIREKSGVDYLNALVWQRTIEGMAANKRALNFEELGRARFMEEHGMTPPRSSTDIEWELQEEAIKHPTRAFGDDAGVARLAGVAAQGISSTLGAGLEAVKAGGVGFGAGAAFGGAVVGAITRNPAAAVEGAIGMGKLVGGKAAGGAALLTMYRYETGASYERNLTASTEEGKLLTNDEAMAGAVLEGLFKSALEGFSFSKQAQVFKGSLPGAVKAALQRDPTFRRLITHVAKDYFESIATETITEGLQQGVEQAGEYLVKSVADGKLQAAPVFRGGEIIAASEGGLAGAVALGGLPALTTVVTTPTVKAASRLALERTADARAEKADQSVGPILDMAADPIVQAAPGQFAEMIKEASGEHGAPLESLHVDAQAVRTYFQKGGESVEEQELIDATGDETAPQRLRDALENGSKLEVPIQQVLGPWGSSALGKAMRNHTSTSATALSPQQREEQKTALKAQSQLVEETVGAELEKEDELEQEREKIEQSVGAQRGKSEGKRIGLLFAHFWRSSASDFKNVAPADIAQQFLTRFFEGDNLPMSETGATAESLVDPGLGEDGSPAPVVGEDAGAAVLEATKELTVDQRARALFIDKNSGLRSERAWNMTPRTPGKQVLVLTTADMKAINDDPSGGHDTTNDLLRVIGREVVKFDPRAALAGPDFRLEIDPGKAEEVRAAVQAALPPGIVLDAGVGATAEEASKAAGASVDAKRASGEYGARGSTNFDTAPLAAPGFRFSQESDAFTGNVSDELMAHVASGDTTPGKFEDNAAFIKEAMYDPKMPGVLSKTGFEAVGERDHVMALDGVGLKGLNDALGKEAGNVYLAIIASVARDLGGEGLFFAHLSGDEYAAKSDDRAVLESFARDLQEELRQVIVEAKAADGKTYRIAPAVRFGIGEKTYGNADRQLNADKRGEAARGVTRGPAFGEVVGDSNQLPRRGNLEAVGRRAESRRGGQTDALGARTEGQDTGFDPEALSPGSTREPSKSTHTAEQMAAARAHASRMRTPNRLRFNRFLDFVEGWATGAERPAGSLSRSEERNLAKVYGVVDPETGFEAVKGLDTFGKSDKNTGRAALEKTTAGKARQEAARKQFETNVLGRVNQEDPADPTSPKGPGFKDKWRANDMKYALRKLEWSRLTRRFADKPLSFKDTNGGTIAVTSVRGGLGGARAESNWRATWFDKDGEPGGHSDRATHAEAVEMAREYGGLVDSVRDLSATKLFQTDEKSGPKNLLVQHNLTGEALQHASKMGGLAAPSIAIARKEHPLVNFGEVTLLGKPELVDPKKGTPTFDADVYSPRYPTTVHKVKVKEVWALEREMKDAAAMVKGYLGDLDNQLAQGGPAVALEKRDVRAAFEAQYLKENKALPKPVMRPARLNTELSKQPALRKFFESKGIDPNYSLDGDYSAQFAEAVKQAAEEYANSSDFADEREMAQEIKQGEIDRWLNEDGTIRFGSSWKLIDDAKKAGTEEINVVPMREAIEKEIEKRGVKEFEAWVQNKLKPLMGEEKIRKLTKAGNFKDIPHTLENVLREMTRELQGGEGFNYGAGSIRSAGAKKFKSLEEIGADRNRIIPSADFEAMKEEANKRFFELVEQSNGEARGMAMSIAESFKRGHSLTSELKKDGITPTSKLVKDIEEFRKWLVALPTEYFEAKPQRIVELQEFEAAVIPSDASAETRAALQKYGLEVVEYDKGDENSRAKAIAAASEKANILFQPGDGETAAAPGANDPKVPKGYTLMPTAAQGRRLFDVFLNAKSDASTAIHEAAHVFLEIMGDLAARADAGERTRQKWLDTLKWMGTTEEKWGSMNADERRDLHEKFAEAFEVYASEGSAPSLELEGVFVRFRDWVLKVFATLKAQRAQINDDIRSVFDRMLATDEEIKRHLGQRGRPLFDNAKDAGMTDAQWADKLEADAEKRDFANRKVWLRAVREQLREKDAIWKEELRAEEKAADNRFDKLPAAIARAIIDGTLADTDAVVFDRKQVVDAVGRKASKRFRTAMTGGRNIDEVGIAAQFPNGKAMLEAVSALPSREEWVAAEAEAAMKKKHGDLLTERETFQKEVAGGLHDFIEKKQLEEWAQLQRAGAKPGMGAPTIPAEAIREAAANMMQRRAVKSLSGPRVLAAERTAATAKAAHAVKGEFDMATAAAKRQLLNSYLYRETLKALDEKEELQDLAKQLSKTSAQAKLGKASPEYRNAVSFILESVGLKKSSEAPNSLGAAVAMMNGSGFAIGDPEWLEGINGVLRGEAKYRTGDRMAALELGNLTVLGMRAVKDALKNLDAAANARNTILRDGKRVDIERSEAEIIANLESTKSKKPTPATKGTETAGDQLRGLLSQADGFLRNPIDKLRELVDDDQESEAFKVLINPVRAAKYREAQLIQKVIEPLTEKMEKMSKEMRANLRAPLPVDLFPGHTTDFSPPRYRHELLVMALNYGNESNAQRLRDGRKITDEQVKNALNLLTKEELAWVQQVFDSAEQLRPEAFALEERLSGLPVEPIKARPLTLTNGTLAGGYFPVVYERAASVAGEKQEASRVLDPNYTRPNTPHSHLKGRADKVEAVISLSVGNVYRGLAQTAHDIAFREALLSGASMVLRPKVQKALKERIGPDGVEQFMRWYTDIGGAQRGERNVYERAVCWIRSNMAPALLGFRPSTALGDFANLLASVPSTALKTHHLVSGLNAYLEAPLKSRELALSKSQELRFMDSHFRKMYDEHLRDFTQRGLLERGPAATQAAGRAVSKTADWLKDNSFVFMEAVAKMTATPVWMGAYRQALTEGKPEAESVRWADDILTQVFPSHSAVEQSALLRNKGFVGLSTVFGGYLNTVFRANARIASPLFTTAFEHSSIGGKAKTIGNVAASLLAFTVAWQLFGELFMGKGAEAGDDDDEEPGNKALRWRNWAGRKLLTGPIQTLPLVSELTNTIDATLTGKQTHGRGGIVAEFMLSLGKGIVDLADGEKGTGDKLEAIWKILGATRGMPQGMNRSLRYLLETSLGERVVEGPGRAVGGAIYGERDGQPDNVPQALGDGLDPLR